MVQIGYSDSANHKLKSGQVGYPDGTNHKLRLIEVGGSDGVNHVVWRNAIPYTATIWGGHNKTWVFSEPLLVHPEDDFWALFSFSLGGRPYTCYIEANFTYEYSIGDTWHLLSYEERDSEGSDSGVGIGHRRFSVADRYGDYLQSNAYLTQIDIQGGFIDRDFSDIGDTSCGLRVNNITYDLAQSGEIEGY